LLFKLLKIPALVAIYFYCRNIRIRNKELLISNGPLLLAVNHPNSFLDAIILATLFKQPIHSLARGDAFNKPWIAALLKSMNILPVYREREGQEHVHKNYGTFDSCINLFKQNGIVLIFTEALCVNEWHLRPLKKGTARLAAIAWQHGIPLRILPIGLNYSSFKLFGKNVHINIGSFICQPLAEADSEGRLLNKVTTEIEQQLQILVYEIDSSNKPQQAAIFNVPVHPALRIVLSPFAVVGYLLHFPIFYPLKQLTFKKMFAEGHYDSVIVGALFLAYPLYVLLFSFICWFTAGGYWWLAPLIFLPFTVWSFVLLKKQTDN